MNRMNGKVCAVTGAAQGLGAAIARGWGGGGGGGMPVPNGPMRLQARFDQLKSGLPGCGPHKDG